MSAYCRVAALDELWSGDLHACEVDGRKLLLVRRGDEVCAYDDRCPHQGQLLSQGTLEGDVLTCAAHHWQFDVRRGCGLNPSSAQLRAHAVAVVDGDVFVDLE